VVGAVVLARRPRLQAEAEAEAEAPAPLDDVVPGSPAEPVEDDGARLEEEVAR